MTLHRLRIRLRSPWRTPWQADTLLGLLCVTAARVHGSAFLRERLLDPMRAGRPPFVLSDGFPGDLLPIPMWVRAVEATPGPDAKRRKRARWLAPDDFARARAGVMPPADALLDDPTVTEPRRHNTLGRDTDASLDEGGLFSRPDYQLASAPGAPPRLSLLARTEDDDALDLFLDLLHELSLVGFGADAATGRGQFSIDDDPEPAADLDTPPPNANALVVLSTFQPAPGDPADGLWEAFPKFAKLGPNLGIADVRKHTLILFRPGACFRAGPSRAFLGRALPAALILPAESASDLHARGIDVVHPAFGLALPAHWS